MKAEEIAKQARESLKDFCFTECGAYCCRKGYLVLTEKELKILTSEKLKPNEEGKFTFYLGDNCPALGSDFKCKIHNSELRPKTCGEFPIFVDGNRVVLSGRCLAVKQNKFYPFVALWKKYGYFVVKTDGGEGYNLRSEEKVW